MALNGSNPEDRTIICKLDLISHAVLFWVEASKENFRKLPLVALVAMRSKPLERKTTVLADGRRTIMPEQTHEVP